MNSIHQVLPCFAQYDAIGHSVLEIQKRIKNRGYASDIFYEHELGPTSKISRPSWDFKYDPYCCGVIYHHSVGSRWPLWLLEHQVHKLVTLYHNITPPEYFASVQERNAPLYSGPAESCRHGVRQLDLLRVISHDAWADSLYNARELEDCGFKEVQILPLLRSYDRLSKLSIDNELRGLLGTKKKTILFVGRVTPNKCQHDLFRFTAILKKQGMSIRLIIPGGLFPPYVDKLKAYAQDLGLKVSFELSKSSMDSDIIFPGQVTDIQLATLYASSRLFFSASEHEGFCVPIVEAMFFGLPIVANSMGAVPETLGSAGELINKNNDGEVIEILTRVLKDDRRWHELREASYNGSQQYVAQKLDDAFNSVFDHTFKSITQWSEVGRKFSIDSYSGR